MNFSKFLENIRIINNISQKYPNILMEAQKELAAMLGGIKLIDLFVPEAYQKFLPQSGIDFFNQVIGGFVPEEGKKTRGINEFINLYRQQHKEAREDHSLAPLRPLYKQILSDRETLSLIPRMFENDEQVLTAIHDMIENHLLNFSKSSAKINVLDCLQTLLKTIECNSQIWIDGAQISQVSKDLLGSWDTLRNIMEDVAGEKFAKERNEEKRRKAIDNWIKNPHFLTELNMFSTEIDGISHPVDVHKLWSGAAAAQRFDAVRKSIGAVYPQLTPPERDDVPPLRERKEVVAQITAVLDAIMDLLHFVKPLQAGEGLERDEVFYSEFDELYNVLDSFVPLYNKVRNYLTKNLSVNSP